ncbi:replication-relaxation family protein [Acidobacteria bacterium AH-259-A15]|nr:replication-relaxation family protein [Acidobacteria bacterium AH-259-A15]
MRLTERCIGLLRLLRAARWLTTGQIKRRFFPGATTDAARKRLRELGLTGYVRKFQANRMIEALFSLGPEGKRELEKQGMNKIRLERRPPKQLAHFLGVNDLRIACELTGKVSYFFAYWELPGLGWSYLVIPDAVFSLFNRTFIAEFDRGVESTRFFVSSKIRYYRQGLDGFQVQSILVITDRKPRMESLMQAIGNGRRRFLFTTIDLIRQKGILAPVFFQGDGGEGIALVKHSSRCLLTSRQI